MNFTKTKSAGANSGWRTRIIAPIATAKMVAALLIGAATGQAEAAPKIVVGVRPVHALVASVTNGIATPRMLAAATPHGFTLKPSHARALEEADLVIWVGPALESFLVKPLKTLARDAVIVTLTQRPEIRLLPPRLAEGRIPANNRRATGIDGHIWFDLDNARAILRIAADALGRIDPANAAGYTANATAARARLDSLDATLRARIAPIRNRPFIMQHDAYQYLERYFGLAGQGALIGGGERRPGARQVRQLRRRVIRQHVACVFTDPHFDTGLLDAVIAGTGARIVVLDPLGIGIAPGPALFGRLLTNNVAALVACLADGGRG